MKTLLNKKVSSSNLKQGQAGSDLVIVLIAVLAVGLVWMFTGGPERLKKSGGTGTSFFTQPMVPTLPTATSSTDHGGYSDSGYQSGSGKGKNQPVLKNSKYTGKVRLERGTAGIEEYTMNEYVRLAATWSGTSTVDITGWKLSNGGRFTGSVEYLVIPTATKYFSITNPGRQEHVVLSKNQSAVITVGKPVSDDPFPINTSFLVNKCSGYLANLGGLKFRPDLPTTCPGVNNEPDFNQVSEACITYFRGIGSCTTFRFDSNGRLAYIGNRYVQTPKTTNLPPSQCYAYAKDHFSYEQCLLNHKNDTDFFGREWRVFLKMNRRFWYSSRDRISLYDNEGKLVDQIIIP